MFGLKVIKVKKFTSVFIVQYNLIDRQGRKERIDCEKERDRERERRAELKPKYITACS